jgi:hypothetical protein
LVSAEAGDIIGSENERSEMAGTIDVHAARIPDRDKLVELLREHGVEASPHGELDIEVPCADDDSAACDEVLAHVEGLVMDLGATMIPIKHDGVIYLRPPTS